VTFSILFTSQCYSSAHNIISQAAKNPHYICYVINDQLVYDLICYLLINIYYNYLSNYVSPLYEDEILPRLLILGDAIDDIPPPV